MNATHFDDFSRGLSGRLSRRATLAGLLPGLLAAGAPDGADAARCRKLGDRCSPRKPKQCCSKRCPNATKRCACRRDRDCGAGQLCANGTCVTGAGTCALSDSFCRTGVNETCNGSISCSCVQDRAGRARCGTRPSLDPTVCSSDADCAAVGPTSFCLPDGGGSQCNGICYLPCAT